MDIEAIFNAAAMGKVKFVSSAIDRDPSLGVCRTIKYIGADVPDGIEVGLEIPAGASDLTAEQIEQLARLAADIPPPSRADGR